MSQALTLQLPEDIISQAESLATLSGFSINEFLTKLLQGIMKPGQSIKENRTFVQKLFFFLSDDEILALAHLEMDSDKLELFNQLLLHKKRKNYRLEMQTISKL